MANTACSNISLEDNLKSGDIWGSFGAETDKYILAKEAVFGMIKDGRIDEVQAAISDGFDYLSLDELDKFQEEVIDYIASINESSEVADVLKVAFSSRREAKEHESMASTEYVPIVSNDESVFEFAKQKLSAFTLPTDSTSNNERLIKFNEIFFRDRYPFLQEFTAVIGAEVRNLMYGAKLAPGQEIKDLVGPATFISNAKYKEFHLTLDGMIEKAADIDKAIATMSHEKITEEFVNGNSIVKDAFYAYVAKKNIELLLDTLFNGAKFKQEVDPPHTERKDRTIGTFRGVKVLNDFMDAFKLSVHELDRDITYDIKEPKYSLEELETKHKIEVDEKEVLIDQIIVLKNVPTNYTVENWNTDNPNYTLDVTEAVPILRNNDVLMMTNIGLVRISPAYELSYNTEDEHKVGHEDNFNSLDNDATFMKYMIKSTPRLNEIDDELMQDTVRPFFSQGELYAAARMISANYNKGALDTREFLLQEIRGSRNINSSRPVIFRSLYNFYFSNSEFEFTPVNSTEQIRMAPLGEIAALKAYKKEDSTGKDIISAMVQFFSKQELGRVNSKDGKIVEINTKGNKRLHIQLPQSLQHAMFSSIGKLKPELTNALRLSFNNDRSEVIVSLNVNRDTYTVRLTVNNGKASISSTELASIDSVAKVKKVLDALQFPADFKDNRFLNKFFTHSGSIYKTNLLNLIADSMVFAAMHDVNKVGPVYAKGNDALVKQVQRQEHKSIYASLRASIDAISNVYEDTVGVNASAQEMTSDGNLAARVTNIDREHDFVHIWEQGRKVYKRFDVDTFIKSDKDNLFYFDTETSSVISAYHGRVLKDGISEKDSPVVNADMTLQQRSKLLVETMFFAKLRSYDKNNFYTQPMVYSDRSSMYLHRFELTPELVALKSKYTGTALPDADEKVGFLNDKAPATFFNMLKSEYVRFYRGKFNSMQWNVAKAWSEFLLGADIITMLPAEKLAIAREIGYTLSSISRQDMANKNIFKKAKGGMINDIASLGLPLTTALKSSSLTRGLSVVDVSVNGQMVAVPTTTGSVLAEYIAQDSVAETFVHDTIKNSEETFTKPPVGYDKLSEVAQINVDKFFGKKATLSEALAFYHLATGPISDGMLDTLMSPDTGFGKNAVTTDISIKGAKMTSGKWNSYLKERSDNFIKQSKRVQSMGSKGIRPRLLRSYNEFKKSLPKEDRFFGVSDETRTAVAVAPEQYKISEAFRTGLFTRVNGADTVGGAFMVTVGSIIVPFKYDAAASIFKVDFDQVNKALVETKEGILRFRSDEIRSTVANVNNQLNALQLPAPNVDGYVDDTLLDLKEFQVEVAFNKISKKLLNDQGEKGLGLEDTSRIILIDEDTTGGPVKLLGALGLKNYQHQDSLDGVNWAHPLYFIKLSASLGNQFSSFSTDGSAVKDLTQYIDPVTGRLIVQKKSTQNIFSNEILAVAGNSKLHNMLYTMNTAITFPPLEIEVPKTDKHGKSIDGTTEKKVFANMQELWEHFGSYYSKTSWDDVSEVLSENPQIRNQYVQKIEFTSGQKTGHFSLNDASLVLDKRTTKKDIVISEVQNQEHIIMLQKRHDFDSSDAADHTSTLAVPSQFLSALAFEGRTPREALYAVDGVAALTYARLDKFYMSIGKAIKNSTDDSLTSKEDPLAGAQFGGRKFSELNYSEMNAAAISAFDKVLNASPAFKKKLYMSMAIEEMLQSIDEGKGTDVLLHLLEDGEDSVSFNSLILRKEATTIVRSKAYNKNVKITLPGVISVTSPADFVTSTYDLPIGRLMRSDAILYALKTKKGAKYKEKINAAFFPTVILANPEVLPTDKVKMILKNGEHIIDFAGKVKLYDDVESVEYAVLPKRTRDLLNNKPDVELFSKKFNIKEFNNELDADLQVTFSLLFPDIDVNFTDEITEADIQRLVDEDIAIRNKADSLFDDTDTSEGLQFQRENKLRLAYALDDYIEEINSRSASAEESNLSSEADLKRFDAALEVRSTLHEGRKTGLRTVDIEEDYESEEDEDGFFFTYNRDADRIHNNYSKAIGRTSDYRGNLNYHVTSLSGIIYQPDSSSDSVLVGNQVGDIFIASHFAPESLRSGVNLIKDAAESSMPILMAVPAYQAKQLEKAGFKFVTEIPQTFGGEIVSKHVMINEAFTEHDLATVYSELVPSFSTNEAGKVIGIASLEAKKILIDKTRQTQDTLPHEYAHHYINMFRNTPLVIEGMELYQGDEEALVQAIGEQAAAQEGKAWNWWTKFTKFVTGVFSKQEVTQVLTDAFLRNLDLNVYLQHKTAVDALSGSEQEKILTESHEYVTEHVNGRFKYDNDTGKYYKKGAKKDAKWEEYVRVPRAKKIEVLADVVAMNDPKAIIDLLKEHNDVENENVENIRDVMRSKSVNKASMEDYFGASQDLNTEQVLNPKTKLYKRYITSEPQDNWDLMHERSTEDEQAILAQSANLQGDIIEAIIDLVNNPTYYEEFESEFGQLTDEEVKLLEDGVKAATNIRAEEHAKTTRTKQDEEGLHWTDADFLVEKRTGKLVPAFYAKLKNEGASIQELANKYELYTDIDEDLNWYKYFIKDAAGNRVPIESNELYKKNFLVKADPTLYNRLYGANIRIADFSLKGEKLAKAKLQETLDIKKYAQQDLAKLRALIEIKKMDVVLPEVFAPNFNIAAYGMDEDTALTTVVGFSTEKRRQIKFATKYFADRIREKSGQFLVRKLSVLTIKNYADTVTRFNKLSIRESEEGKRHVYKEIADILLSERKVFDDGKIDFTEADATQILKRINKHIHVRNFIGTTEKGNIEKSLLVVASEKRARSFVETLEVMPPRIPGQGKQSGYLAKIKGFIHSNRNAIYSPRESYSNTGQDNDIDTNNVITRAIDENGYQYEYNKYIHWVNDVDGKKVDGGIVDKDGHNIYLEKELIKLEEVIRERAKLDKTLKAKDIESIVYSKINAKREYFEKAVQNYVIDKMKAIMSDPMNMVEMETPISMDTLKAVTDIINARKSNKYYDATIHGVNSFNSAWIPVLEELNMQGNSGIADYANGQRILSGINTVQAAIGRPLVIGSGWRTNQAAGVTPGTGFTIEIPGEEGGLSTRYHYADTSPDPETTNLKEYKDLNIDEVMAELEIIDNERISFLGQVKAWETLSQLLSAATDNAKELILGQIKANTDTNGVIATMIILGFEFSEVYAFLQQPALAEVFKELDANKNKFEPIGLKGLLGAKQDLNDAEKDLKDLIGINDNMNDFRRVLTMAQNNRIDTHDLYKVLSPVYRRAGLDPQNVIDGTTDFTKVEYLAETAETETSKKIQLMPFNPLFFIHNHMHAKSLLKASLVGEQMVSSISDTDNILSTKIIDFAGKETRIPDIETYEDYNVLAHDLVLEKYLYNKKAYVVLPTEEGEKTLEFDLSDPDLRADLVYSVGESVEFLREKINAAHAADNTKPRSVFLDSIQIQNAKTLNGKKIVTIPFLIDASEIDITMFQAELKNLSTLNVEFSRELNALKDALFYASLIQTKGKSTRSSILSLFRDEYLKYNRDIATYNITKDTLIKNILMDEDGVGSYMMSLIAQKSLAVHSIDGVNAVSFNEDDGGGMYEDEFDATESDDSSDDDYESNMDMEEGENGITIITPKTDTFLSEWLDIDPEIEENEFFKINHKDLSKDVFIKVSLSPTLEILQDIPVKLIRRNTSETLNIDTITDRKLDVLGNVEDVQLAAIYKAGFDVGLDVVLNRDADDEILSTGRVLAYLGNGEYVVFSNDSETLSIATDIVLAENNENMLFFGHDFRKGNYYETAAHRGRSWDLAEDTEYVSENGEKIGLVNGRVHVATDQVLDYSEKKLHTDIISYIFNAKTATGDSSAIEMTLREHINAIDAASGVGFKPYSALDMLWYVKHKLTDKVFTDRTYINNSWGKKVNDAVTYKTTTLAIEALRYVNTRGTNRSATDAVLKSVRGTLDGILFNDDKNSRAKMRTRNLNNSAIETLNAEMKDFVPKGFKFTDDDINNIREDHIDTNLNC